MRPTALLAVLAIAAACAPHAADAATLSRYDYQAGAAFCQPVLPEHGTSLRSQPLTGLQNTGTATIFVTCAPAGDDSAGGRGASRILVNVANYGTAGFAQVDCTLVNGAQSGSSVNATYTTRSGFPSLGSGTFIAWEPATTTGTPASINRPQFMCSLPVGVAVQFIAITYSENIGN